MINFKKLLHINESNCFLKNRTQFDSHDFEVQFEDFPKKDYLDAKHLRKSQKKLQKKDVFFLN